MQRRQLILSGSLALCANAVVAQTRDDFPVKPIRLIVPFPAGTAPDVIARLLGEQVQRSIKQPVFVDNRPGAAGMIGADVVAKSAPDGYTIFICVNSILTLNPHIYRKIAYNAMRDFAPVTQLTRASYALVANNDFPAKNFADFIAMARAQPGKIDYASPGIGSSPHVIMELLSQMAGDIQLHHIPFTTTGLTEVMGGQVPVSFEPIATAIPVIASQRVRALAVTSAKRLSVLPDVPAVAEFYPGYDGDGWHGIFAPGKTPKPIIDRLNMEFVKAVHQVDVKKRLGDLGLPTVGGTPDNFDAVVKSDFGRWEKVVRAAKISIE